MEFGLNINGLRTKPTSSGETATCPFCGGNLIGKCGEIYAWHWQHSQNQECDPWQEPETPWHRKWKARFPDNCQEIIIERSGEKHRADIKTSNGVVIEFQHSSISSSTIRIREHFYENMIWVVDARSFKDHFKFRSIVKSELRDIEFLSSNALYKLEAEYDEKLKDIQSRIDKNGMTCKEKLDNINYKNKNFEELNDLLNSFEAFTHIVVAKWSEDQNHWEHATYKITDAVSQELKSQLTDINRAIRVLALEIESAQKALVRISNFEDYQIANITYKLISYAQVTSEVFYKTKAILKTSIPTLFPVIVSFNNEIEFKDYQYKQNLFSFAIDPTETVNAFNTKISEATLTIKNYQATLLSITDDISNQMLIALRNRILILEEEIKTLQIEWDEYIRIGNGLTARQSRLISEKQHEISQSTIIIQKEKKDLEYKIMNEKKGDYTFTWKNERKSWQAAKKPIYFDVGEKYLWKYINGGTLKKIMIDDFISTYLGI